MLNSARGFTIPELLITSFLGLLITGLLLSVMQSNRSVLGKDIARTTLNQNLRGALDIVAADIRVGGENLPESVPAIEIVNGSSGASDELVVRRNLFDEVLPVCAAITAGTSSNVYFAVSGTVPGCVYSGQMHSFNIWNVYRQQQPGQELQAFIYDSSTRQGEFFTVTSEINTGVEFALVRGAGSWQNSYPVGSSAVYVLEEWRYRLQGENLQLVQNRDSANPFNVSFGMTDFQAEAEMQDGTVKSSFLSSDDWTEISALRITLSGTETHGGELMARTLTGEFFPRNVLSH
ncbi:MAG: hypothetical protein J5J00_12450 [Deltaproteobacteria bacterium]|nr:hypothetical protein [Deltaproteobacteria bacterium]